MIKNETAEINGRVYRIIYVYPGEWMKETPYRIKSMVRVEHDVVGNYFEEAVENYFENDKAQLLQKIESHLTENKESFERIDVEYDFDGLGFNISRVGGNRLVNSMVTSLKTKLK